MESINKFGNYKIAVSLDGCWILSKNKDTIVVQDTLTKEVQRSLSKRSNNKKKALKGVNLSAKSINGCWLILGFIDNTFDEWYLPQKFDVYNASDRPPFLIKAVSADNQLALRETKRGLLQIQDIKTGKAAYTSSEKIGDFDWRHSKREDRNIHNPSDGIVFSADGDFVILPRTEKFNSGNSDFDPEIGYRIWNFQNKNITPILISCLWSMDICSATVSFKSKIGIFGLTSGEIKLCDLSMGREIFSLNKHQTEITCLGVSSDDRFLVSGSLDGTLQLWSLINGDPITSFKLDTEIYLCMFHPNNNVIIAGDNTEKVNLFEIMAVDTQSQDQIIELAQSKLTENFIGELWALAAPVNCLNFKGIPDIGTIGFQIRFEGIGIFAFLLYHKEYGVIYENEHISEEYQAYLTNYSIDLPRAPWDDDLLGVLKVTNLLGELVAWSLVKVSCALNTSDSNLLKEMKTAKYNLLNHINFESALKFLNIQSSLIGNDQEDIESTLRSIIDFCKDNSKLSSEVEKFTIKLNQIEQNQRNTIISNIPRLNVYVNAEVTNPSQEIIITSKENNCTIKQVEQRQIQDELKDLAIDLENLIHCNSCMEYQEIIIDSLVKIKIIIFWLISSFKKKVTLNYYSCRIPERSNNFAKNITKFIFIIYVFYIFSTFLGLLPAAWLGALASYFLVVRAISFKGEMEKDIIELFGLGFLPTLFFIVPFIFNNLLSGISFGSSLGIDLSNRIVSILKFDGYWRTIFLFVFTSTLGYYTAQKVIKTKPQSLTQPLVTIIFIILCTTLLGAKKEWGVFVWTICSAALLNKLAFKLSTPLKFVITLFGILLGFQINAIVVNSFSDNSPQVGIAFRSAIGALIGSILSNENKVSISGVIGSILGVILGFYILKNSFQLTSYSMIPILLKFMGGLIGSIAGIIAGIIYYILFAIPASFIIACLVKLLYELALDINRN
jgi:WD40 repeat protein